MIGLLLVLIAIVLGIETKSLLVGEGASEADHDRIVDAIHAGDEVEKLIHIKTLYLGPDELLVAAKIALTSDKTVRAAADDIDTIEARIRKAVPAARVIYLEPDIYRPTLDPTPSTDASCCAPRTDRGNPPMVDPLAEALADPPRSRRRRDGSCSSCRTCCTAIRRRS